MSMADDNVQKRLVRQWRETGRVLREIRLAELAAMRDEESRYAALDMLNLASALSDDPRRERHSGLVEMQRLFSTLRERIPA
jgi:hypothetical protein